MEEQEAIKNELTASETLYNAYMDFEFNENERGYMNLLLDSNQDEILVENIPFVWESATRQISISFPNNILQLNAGLSVRNDGSDKEGNWETDLTEKFLSLYPDIRSVKKILHYRLCE